ncbi:hypothetical protein 1 [Wenzhou picorna-like virus 7]|uniref:hypothetical protein 1 n=1 Tax=Wenzhou picorna-like virus 7 TaxID=1923644 RepID=UPI000909AB14|nr:hypothetical protein 1 [Wenzhou picorna-like virus 7]APG78055.1 hypothetical protein 1 [Wenzhou picorna-like virus 7]
MNKFLKTSTYGKSDKEKQVCQRPASHTDFELHNYTNPWLVGKDKTWCQEKRLDKARDLRREHYRSFEPQAGFEFAKLHSVVSDLAKYANIDYTDELVVQLEGIVALVFTLQGCQDYVAMSSAIFLYVRKFFDKSITSHVMEYISELFEVEPQYGEEGDVVQSESWIDMMRNLRDNWTLVKDNKLFSHFSKLLGLVVTLELCKASDLTFTVKEFKMWEPDMKVVHGNAVDVFDAALSTVTFFVENLSMCWEQKSLKPLLINDKAAAELDEEYANVVMWWDLLKNGNLKRVACVSEQEFDRRLETLTTKIRNLIGNLKSFEKKILQDKFMRLLKIKNDYITMKISSGVRKSPFCIELFGASSQGKTTFGEQVIQALLTSAGLPTGKEYQASYNAADKFMSTWTTDKLVLLIDDMANDKSNFVERPPTRVIIDVANNAPFYANMADLDSKGKVFVEPELCVVTTNVKDLDARTYSNCPYSIQRRMHIVVTVSAKVEFQYTVDGKPQGIDPAKVAAFNKDKPDMAFDDIWELTLEKAVCPEKLSIAAGYAPVIWRGKKMEKVSFREAIQYLIEKYHEHITAQENILERMKKRQDICVCGVDGCKQIKGWCDVHPVCKEVPLDNHFGDEIVESIQNAGSLITNRIRKDIFGLDRAVEGACTLAILGAAKHFAKHWDWMSLVPTPWLSNNKFRNAMLFVHKDKLKNSYIRKTCLMWGSIFGAMWCVRKQPRELTMSLGTGLFAAGITVQKSMVEVVKRDFDQQLVDRNTIAPVLKEFRDKHVNNICKACAIVGALYGISRVYKAWRKINPQGSLEPKIEEDVRRRDAEANVWTSVVQRELPVNSLAASTTSDQLLGLVEKNLVYGSVQIGDRTLRVNGLFLTSNVVVIPDHYFEAPVLDVTFRKSNPDAAGGKFATRLSLAQSIKLPETDIRVCYSASGGSFKDLRKYLPLDDLPMVEFSLRWRSKSGELEKAAGLATQKRTGNGAAEFKGLYYESLTMDTFRGMCGAVLVAKQKPILLGIHLGGRSGTPKGCAGILFASQVNKAVEDLRKLEGVIVSGSAERFETQVLGVNLLTGDKLHPKSPLNFMPENSQVEFYGTCPGMSVFRSDVKVTPISEHVTDVTGVPNIYRPPVEDPQWFGWQTCLVNLAVPALPFDPMLLILAIRDYKEDMIPILQSRLWRDARPLNDHENLCGIPCVKFVDSIKLDTSIGFPLGGSKRRFVVELPPTKEKPNNRVFDDVIMDEIHRCLECYKRGERAYVIARACKKDEVLSKAKCRIFYGNGIALTFLVRKFFLPILRIMQFNPKVSECAVGVNSHGPEWQELHDHIFTFGEDRLIGGDYGKYDQKLPSQLIFAALRIMIDFARECDYSEEDLKVMEAMTGDIVFATIAYNGDLIGLTEGTHISGNSLTVIINGICGSLNLRCFFYSKNPAATFEERKKFREYVKLVTYGDDNIGSVSKDINNFTIKGASEFLAEYGQTYTMPDKESELLDFLPFEEFEFLKRKSVWHPELGVHTGALIEKSCFKMLHCFLRGKKAPLTAEHMAGQNIDTALREWFNHGPEVYEKRRVQMKEVAARAGITHLCMELDTTYDECVLRWKAKYQDGSRTHEFDDAFLEIFGDL